MRFPDPARRARLARRHALHPDHRQDSPEAAARAVVALHATEAATVHLAVAARMRDPAVPLVDVALYDDRTLVKQLAMRRTLFAFPAELLPAVWGSASARVAEQELRRLTADLLRHGVTDDGAAWIERGRRAVLGRLAGGVYLGARELRDQLPELAGRTRRIEGGTRWNLPDVPFAPRLLTVLGAEHSIVRGRNAGHWRLSRPTWTLMADWLDDPPPALAGAEGYAELVRRWLRSFGPGTEADLVWWLGATKTTVRSALEAVGAARVTLDSGATGWVLPGDDAADDPTEGDWAALLPVLDPTTMGWRQRDFYLPPALAPLLFDSNGNAGTTAWVNGRIVGCWVQDDDGRVRVLPGVPLPPAHADLLHREADRLTGFLDGVVIGNVYKSRLMQGTALP